MVPGSRTIQVVADAEEMTRVASRVFFRCMDEAVRREGRFSVALSGGRTPRALYEALSQGGVEPAASPPPWDKTFVATVDERHVPPGHKENNYSMIEETLLRPLAIPPRQVARFLSEAPEVATCARAMVDRLGGRFGRNSGPIPRFDLILLGMGADGHTASLFSGCDALRETHRPAVATWIEKQGAWRFTLTPPTLNNAREVVFLVAGADKAETLKEVLEGPRDPARLPAQIIEPVNGSVTWIVDSAAAGRLEG